MKSFRFLIATAALALFSTAVCFGQATLGVIAGSVTDNSDAVVQGATVTVQRVEGGEPKEVKTGSAGDYRVESLTPGTYTVKVSAGGFSNAELANIVVNASITTPVNVRLNVGATTETVQVDASAQRVQTETGDLSGVIPTVEIKDLPIASGNPYDLAKTLPGVLVGDSRTTGFGNGVEFNVDGLRTRANNFLIDGFDNNDYGITGQALQSTNQEAISQVAVLKNSYAAEYGRGGGSVSNLTYRSGSNSIHGAVWEQYFGNALEAVTPEQAASGVTEPPHVVSNLFGFRVGGPIIKDKLFYFGTSQWTRVFGASTFAAQLQLPTQAGVNALQSIGPNTNVQILVDSLAGLRGSTADPSLLSTVNIGNRPGCGSPCIVEVGPFTRSDTTKSLSREWTARVDYQPTSVDNLFARYTDTQGSFSPDLFANATALPSADTQQGGPARNMGVMWAHTFSAFAINEFRFSAQTISFGFDPTAATLANPLAHLPGLNLTSSFGQNVFWGGFSQGTFPQSREHKTFQFQDAVSFNRGSHTFKVGVDLAVLLVQDQIPFNLDGTITYSSGGDCSAIGLTPCTDLANYVDDFSGPSGTINKQFGSPLISAPTNQQAYYFQDSWKVRPNLTLTYGVRYEYQPPDAANVLPFPAVNRATVLTDPFQQRTEVRPDRNNWGPRFGFSYSPRGKFFGENKTVIRGGAGIFFDSFFTNISDNTAATAPNTLGGNILGGPAGSTRGTSGTFAAIQAIPPNSDPANTVFSVPADFRNPQTYQWNLNVQRELPGKFIAEVAYVGTRGTRLWNSEQLNPADFLTYPDRLNPNRGSIVVRGNRGDSNYHGLQAQVSRTVGRLSLLGAYTFSRAIDNASDVFATSGGASRWEITNDPRIDRGPSALHHKHRASITWVYDFPSPSHSFLNAVLGGWSSSGSIAFQSGAPETVFLGGWDQNGDGEGFNDRPFDGNHAAKVNASDACLSNPTCVTGVGFDDGSGNLIDFLQALFTNNPILPITADQARYVVFDFASGNSGNVGRNSFYLPGTQTYNLSAIKRFKIPFRESQMEFRADFFNAFNHPNEGVNVTGYGDLLSPGIFGNLKSTLGGARTIQLWLKYSF